MLRFPVPLVLAAIVATMAVVVYLMIEVRPMVPVADGNFSTPLTNGSVYLWRGSAKSITFHTDGGDIDVSYFVPAYIIYLNGPPGNATIRENMHIATSPFVGTWLLIKNVEVYSESGLSFIMDVAFKLEPTQIGEITVYVPIYADYLASEYDEVYNLFRQALGYSGPSWLGIVTDIQASEDKGVLKLFSNGAVRVYFYKSVGTVRIADGGSFKFSFAGTGFSYQLEDLSVSGFAMPYVFFIIKPYSNTTVTITLQP
jgi:hypothetical protein